MDALSHDGKHLAYGMATGNLEIWNVDEGPRVSERNFQHLSEVSFGGAVRSAAFLPDGRLITGGSEGSIRSFDLKSDRYQGDVVSSGHAEDSTVSRIIIPPKDGIADELGQFLTFDSYDKLQFHQGGSVLDHFGSERPMTAAFSQPTGKFLGLVTSSGVLQVYEAGRIGKPVHSTEALIPWRAPANSPELPEPSQLTVWAKDLHIDEAAQKVRLFDHHSSTLFIWDLQTGEVTRRHPRASDQY